MIVTYNDLVVPSPKDRMLDITAPETVEIQISNNGKVVWINIDGHCMVRACRIGKLTVQDNRSAQP